MRPRLQNLLVVSHTPHYRLGSQIVGWGPTVRELDHLATLFNEVVHLAPLHQESAPACAIPYSARNLQVAAVPPSGGVQFRHKFSVLFCCPTYARTLLRELRRADAVQVRCPANLSLLAIIVLAFRRQPRLRWIKYAGNWQSNGQTAWTNTFQKWWLQKGWARGWVTINGNCANPAGHIRSFLNPCMTDEELAEARHLVAHRLGLSQPRILFVGSLDSNKGVLRAWEVFRRVCCFEKDARFEIVGDGPERQAIKEKIRQAGLDQSVTVHGWLARGELGKIYARNHFLLLMSRTEGWPKVLSEAMAYGLVPIASAISCVPTNLQHWQTGRTFDVEDLQGFAGAIADYCRAPELWREESRRAIESAQQFSYSHYLAEVSRLLGLNRDAQELSPFSLGSDTEPDVPQSTARMLP